jgi:membrane protease YdiL (CAAX protease family)
MKKIKKPLLFTLAMLPIAALAGYFVTMYQLNLYDQEIIEALISQAGSIETIVLTAVIQTMTLAAICGFFGHIISEKIGLMKSFRLERTSIIRTLLFSVVFGIAFSFDYWTFGLWIPDNQIRDAIAGGLTAAGWISSVLYGGIVEELMLRLFVMSLIALILWRIFFRKNEKVPNSIFIAANVLSAMLFAAGHLPATITLFGKLTPIILFRCFLLNGSFGLFFGWLYRKYGIQYAMVGHAMLHIVSKTIWFVGI